MGSKSKRFCTSDDCSFRPIKFNTFEYMYCDHCKEEVDEDLVERTARYRASRNVNPHLNEPFISDLDETDQGDLFDFT